MDVFISEIQKRNVLWNKLNPLYNHRLAVDKEWESVAECTSFSKDAKKKWRNLRDQFIKELKKCTKSRTGDAQECADSYSGRWQYFTSMLFLKDTVIPRGYVQGNLPLVDEQNPSSREEMDDVEEEEEEEQYTNPGIDVSELLAPPSLSPVPVQSYSHRKRQRQDTDLEQRKLDIESKKLALYEKSEDENFLFLRSLLPYFKCLDQIQQLRVRTRFQEILLQEISQSRSSSAQ
ncbi:uncharacterized protein isoform X2 [Rhodnius prolixus]|uniref:uncharacterized protein isoform X2 n=1 Tax=Rhodnius prolixus TaxID=13249 RepID=UPI003D18AAB3